MDQLVAKVYKGYGNAVAFELRANVAPRFPVLNLAQIDRLVVEFVNSSAQVTIDTDNGEGYIDLSDPEVLKMHLGFLDIPDGTYNVSIVAYDVNHPQGQVLIGAELPDELAFEFITP